MPGRTAISALSPVEADHRAIRDARLGLGLTREEAAARCGRSPATLRSVEIGHQQPGSRFLYAMAATYGVPIESLMRPVKKS
jgi:transcriptional regulator with XRE-family HTH domain